MIHLQASGLVGFPVSNQTQESAARFTAGKARMISVMTSSFRRTLVASRKKTPKGSAGRHVVAKLWS
jgi:hypothetical protein